MARRKKGLSAEDRELWDRVKRTATPLTAGRTGWRWDPGKHPGRTRKTGETPRRRSERHSASGKPHRRALRTAATPRPVGPHRAGAHPHETDSASPDDPGQDETRGADRPARDDPVRGAPGAGGFRDVGAHARGLRLLLVITGKGRGGDREDHGPDPDPSRRPETAGSRLADGAAAGPLVLEIREAHQRHGGGGAYYVYLRRPPRRRSQHVTAEIRAARQFAEVLFDEGRIHGDASRRGPAR
jgi:DNA-nicking Smr family endonuclease